MPIDTSFQHPPSASERERMEHRQLVAAGTSPFYGGTPRPQPLDTSVTATCPECHARFIAIGDRSAEDNLQGHTQSRHAPRAKSAFKVSDEGAAAVDHITETVMNRIDAGELKPGMPVMQGALASEIGCSRHYVQVAVDALVAQGTLGYLGAGVGRRVIVVGS